MRALLPLLLLAVCASGAGVPLSASLDAPVRALASAPGGACVCGDFASPAPFAARFNESSSSLLPFPGVSLDAPCLSCISSGSTVFLAGSFSGALLAVRSSGQLSPASPTSLLDSAVSALCASSSQAGTVFLGGSFSSRVASLDAASLQLTPLASSATHGPVVALAHARGALYSASESRPFLQRLQGSSWETILPALDGPVLCFLASGTDLFLGGSFSSGVLHFDLASGANSTLGASLPPPVRALAMMPASGDLVAGGSFLQSPITNLATFDGVAWNRYQTPAGGIDSLLVRGSSLYVAGEFTSINLSPAPYATRITVATQAPTAAPTASPSPMPVTTAAAIPATSTLVGTSHAATTLLPLTSQSPPPSSSSPLNCTASSCHCGSSSCRGDDPTRDIYCEDAPLCVCHRARRCYGGSSQQVVAENVQALECEDAASCTSLSDGADVSCDRASVCRCFMQNGTCSSGFSDTWRCVGPPQLSCIVSTSPAWTPSMALLATALLAAIASGSM